MWHVLLWSNAHFRDVPSTEAGCWQAPVLRDTSVLPLGLGVGKCLGEGREWLIKCS